MIFDFLFIMALQIISFSGYLGVFILMTLESTAFPMPSEAVMPFAGFLIAEGKMDLLFVIIASSVGSIFGSLISYYIGLKGGKPFILRYGKYVLLSKHHLDITERFFKRRGSLTIFISRFIPVVRHVISIPAGIGKMDLKKFLILTAVGATIWNSILTYIGFILRDNWSILMSYTIYFDIVIIAFLIILVMMFIRRIKEK